LTGLKKVIPSYIYSLLSGVEIQGRGGRFQNYGDGLLKIIYVYVKLLLEKDLPTSVQT